MLSRRLLTNVIFLWLLWWTACTAPSATPTPTIAPTVRPTLAPVTAPETAAVTRIIDGDTIEVQFPDGRTHRLRYIGMDTPERGQPFFDEATIANAALVAGQTVTLVKDVSETDRYGRLLRYVYNEDGTFVNAELVRLGYARVATYPPDVTHRETFTDLERLARLDGRGLWADNPLIHTPTPRPPTPAATAITAVCDCSGNRYNCGRFQTHDEAQACFLHCLQTVGRDVHRLDGDGDGRACESLP